MMKFIVFEGIDGCGKTTLINELQKQLNTLNIPHTSKQGLGSSSIGPIIRDLFLNCNQLNYCTRFYLSLANMFQTQKEFIKPTLKQNKMIILDRYLSSTFAYQLYPFFQNNDNNNYIDLQNIFNVVHEKLLIQPHLIIYIDIDPIIGKQRKQNQTNHKCDLIENKPLSYFQKVREGYFHYLTHYYSGAKFILDGSNPVNLNILKIINLIGRLNNGDHHQKNM